MVLIGNYSVLNKTPGRWLAGPSLSENRSNWSTPGAIRNMWVGSGFNLAQSHPCGYDPEYSIYDAQRVGGIASRNEVTGAGNIGGANLAGGINIDLIADIVYLSSVATMTGAGRMVIYTTSPSALSGSGNINASIFAIAVRSAGLTGFDTVTASSTPVATLAAALTASGNVTAAGQAILSAVAAVTGTGNITSAAAFSLIQAVAAITGSGAISAAATALGIGAATLAASGDITAAIVAFGRFSAALTGSGNAVGTTPRANGTMSAGINVTGDILNTANVGNAVWQSLIDGGYSAQDIMRILAAVAAGKTDIATVGPTTTVTFRDVNDTKNAVVATMSGSERATVTLNP